MAFLDWNHNGRRDTFDRFMDYQIYRETFGRDEGERDHHYTPHHVSRQTNQKRNARYSSSEDIYGVSEIAGKSTEEIMRILISRKEKMNAYFRYCSVKSGFRAVFDNRQMEKDFWLYDFAKLLDFSKLQKKQKIKLLQLLLNTFKIENPMTAEAHYEYMVSDVRYYQYMNWCFGIESRDCALFWIILVAMSGNESERLPIIMEFTKEHTKFMVQLEEYLKCMFPGCDFGEHAQLYLQNLISYVSDALNNSGFSAIRNRDKLVNPIFPLDCR